MKKHSFIKLVMLSLLVITLGFLSAEKVSAMPVSIETGDEVIIDEEVNGALSVAGDTIVVEENVNGTVFLTGNAITVNGDIDGNLFAAGQSITINGKVNGSVFVAGQGISNNGTITGDIFAAGQAIILEEGGVIEGSAFTAGQSVDVSGPIERDLFVGASSLRLANTVGRDAVLATETINPSGEALIQGDLIYEAPRADSEVEEITQGEVQFQQASTGDMRETRREKDWVSVIPDWWKIASAVGTLISASLIWWFLHVITDGRFIILSRVGPGQVVINILIGLGMTILLPIVILLTLLSLVLARLAILISLFLFALFLLAQIITAAAISEYMVRPRWSWAADKPYVSFILTFFGLYLINNIPFIGWLIAMISIFYAVGLVFVEIWDRLIHRQAVVHES